MTRNIVQLARNTAGQLYIDGTDMVLGPEAFLSSQSRPAIVKGYTDGDLNFIHANLSTRLTRTSWNAYELGEGDLDEVHSLISYPVVFSRLRDDIVEKATVGRTGSSTPRNMVGRSIEDFNFF